MSGIAVPLVMCAVALPGGLRDRQAPAQGTAQQRSAPAPQTADGKPDLSGVWRPVRGSYLTNLAADGGRVPFQPEAAAQYRERQAGRGKGRPSERCLPRGVPSAMLVRDRPWKIVQTPAAITILYDDSLHYRQIFTDGRGFPEDPTPTWFGYSIARWEGDTLVAQTIGLNAETWLDDGGHPHSEALRVTERFRRRTVGAMTIDITIDDSEAYTKPWTVTVPFETLPDTALGEHVCAVGSRP